MKYNSEDFSFYNELKQIPITVDMVNAMMMIISDEVRRYEKIITACKESGKDYSAYQYRVDYIKYKLRVSNEKPKQYWKS